MAFTKINAAGIGTTETVTVDGLTVINDGSFGGNLTVSGVLTYEDVTNVDSVGLITARNGIVVGSGITLSKDGDIFATGITTVSGNVKVGTGITLSPDGDGFFTGVITATSYSGIDLSDVTGATGDFSIADKIVHTGDTNTAIRFPAADTITAETGGTERLRINSDGRIAINDTGLAAYTTFSPCLAIGDSGDSTPGLVLRGSSTSNCDISFCDNSGTESDDGVSEGLIRYEHSNDAMIFHTADGERLRIDNNGRLVIGHTSAQTVNSQSHRIQLIGTTYATSGLSQQRYQDNSSGASIILSHSRNGTIGNQTALQSGDELGKIRFVGSDGVDLENVGAQIVVTADGNYSSDSVPGKIEFGTTSNGSASPTTRMTIDQNGYVKINSTDGAAYHTTRLDTTTNNAIKDVMQIQSSVTGATAASGFGARLLFSGEQLNGNNYNYGGIAGLLSSTGSTYGHLAFYTNNNGTLGEKMRITDASSGTVEIYGNSASIRTIESSGATALMQSGGNQAYFGTPSGNSKAVTFTVAGSHIAHFTTQGDMMLDNQLQTSSGVEPVAQLSFSGPSGAMSNQTDMYRINFWESARTISSARADNSNASVRYNGSTDDGGDGSIRFANENGTRLLYMNRLGNGGTSGSWSVGSDQRKKENITTVSDALTKVSQLRGVDFKWRAKWGGHADSGVIAQEVESVLPNLVITQEGARDTDDDGNSVVMKHVNYNGLWGAMIEAVKELKSKNEALEARIAALEG